MTAHCIKPWSTAEVFRKPALELSADFSSTLRELGGAGEARRASGNLMRL